MFNTCFNMLCECRQKQVNLILNKFSCFIDEKIYDYEKDSEDVIHEFERLSV